MQIRHGLVHCEHHLLITVHSCGLSAWPVVIIEIRCHILPDYASIPLVNEVFEVVSYKLFHLFGCQVGWHFLLLWFGGSSYLQSACSSLTLFKHVFVVARELGKANWFPAENPVDILSHGGCFAFAI